MTTLLWSVTGVFALLWSGLAWACAALVRWAVDALVAGGATEAGQAVVRFELPGWLAPFVDSGLVTAVQGFVAWLVNVAASGAPMAGSAIGWLVPLVWTAWAFGLVLLLAFAGGAHLLLRKIPKIGAPAVA